MSPFSSRLAPCALLALCIASAPLRSEAARPAALASQSCSVPNADQGKFLAGLEHFARGNSFELSHAGGNLQLLRDDVFLLLTRSRDGYLIELYASGPNDVVPGTKTRRIVHDLRVAISTVADCQ